jgi:hypothetical protein
MSANQASFPIAAMARVLGVSKAGHYAWLQRPPSAHATADTVLLKRIKTVHASSRQTYGAPRVHADLRGRGERRQPFSAPPSDSTRELAPVTAKIAMRKSGPITTPVSLTSRNSESASSAEDGVSGGRCVGLDSGSASFRISGAAGAISAGGEPAPGEGRWLLMEPNSIRISPAQTTHPTRIKARKRIICFNTIGVCQSKDFIDAPTEARFQKKNKAC